MTQIRCLTDDALDQLFLGNVPEELKKPILHHLGSCPRCRERRDETEQYLDVLLPALAELQLEFDVNALLITPVAGKAAGAA